jgi:hypothetical protein
VDSLLGSPPETGTDQTSLLSPYSTLFPSEINGQRLNVLSVVNGTTLSTCGIPRAIIPAQFAREAGDGDGP